MNNNTSPNNEDGRNVKSAVGETDDNLSDFATAEVPSSTREFAASIDNSIDTTTIGPSPVTRGASWVFSQNGPRRRSSSIL